MRLERISACPVCGSASATGWRFACRDWQRPASTERYEYASCGDCGAFFQSVRPVEEDIHHAYFEGYGPYDPHSPGASPPAASLILRAASVPLAAGSMLMGGVVHDRLGDMIERTYAPARPGYLLLDYGCGSAAFLDEARDRGWSTLGADFTQAVLEGVEAAGHRTVLVGEPLRREVADATVHCVRMNHVVEHLYRPREALADIRRLLAPGGRVHIATPNPAGLGARVYRSRWFSLDAPRHLVLFRPEALSRLLLDAGFRDPVVVHEVVGKDLLRSQGIVRYERGKLAHGQIGALATDRPRSRAVAPVARLAAALRIADRYHVFAGT